MARIDVNINPNALRWAREEAGYELSEIALKVKKHWKIWVTVIAATVVAIVTLSAG